MTTFAIVTFGCRVNQADALGCEEAFVRRGASPAPPETADIVVVNSCSVTATADQGTRQLVRRVARTNPRARIVVTGCYASRDPSAVASLPGVERVVANTAKDTLVEDLFGDPGMASLPADWGVGDNEGPCGHVLGPGLGGRTAFTLRAQTGCEEACSYCIIPTTRGASRSQSLAALVEQVRRLEQVGYREVVLTGVHLGSYGRDLVPRRSLADLLWAVAEATPGVLYRIGSLEPMDCSADVLDVMTTHPRLAPHFHLPLQHGSDRVLSAMRRPYRMAYFAELVETIRVRLPHAAIGSDVIAGFPGETEVEAAATEDYLARSPLSHVHVFPYSDRPGTPAASLPHKVSGIDVRARAARLRAVSRGLTDAFHARQLDTVRPALTVEDGTSVVTDNYLKVSTGSVRPRNQRVHVRIEGVVPSLTGSIVAHEAGA